MANDDGIKTFGLTEQPRIVFPKLFHPEQFKGKNGKKSGKEKFSATFLFNADGDEIKSLKKTAMAIARARWPDRDIAADFKAGEFNLPFTGGAKAKAAAEKNGHDGSFYDGTVVLKTSTEFRPTVLDGRQDPPAETLDEKLIYSGCYGAGEVNFAAYDGVGNGNDGVTAYINCAVFVAPGDRIAGKDHAKSFAGIKGSAKTEDPTGGGSADDDEIEI